MRALSDIRVLEFGSYLAAPLAGKHLADAGLCVTSVIKPLTTERARIEHEYMKHTLHHLRRHKRVVEIDLKANVEAAINLIKESDVLIENLSRGSMERLGLGYEACKRINPQLIYVSMPGYNSLDAEHAPIIPWDSIIMASAGVF